MACQFILLCILIIVTVSVHISQGRSLINEDQHIHNEFRTSIQPHADKNSNAMKLEQKRAGLIRRIYISKKSMYTHICDQGINLKVEISNFLSK